jgi:hypothetical protein
MRVRVESRVEQSLRYLKASEASKIRLLLIELESLEIEGFRQRPDVRKLAISGQEIYVIRANIRLRIICRYDGGQILVIEDIVSHDALEKYFSGRRR